MNTKCRRAGLFHIHLKKKKYGYNDLILGSLIHMPDEKLDFCDAFIVILTRTAFKLKTDKACQLLTLLEQPYQL